MKFRFCGEADCPDWVLAEINTISRLSSVKLKVLTQIVAQGIIKPPIDVDKAEKLFSDSKLDPTIDLKACIACLCHIISSTTQSNCDSTALHSELQQLGLPREHSTSIKRVIDAQNEELIAKFKSLSLKINNLDNVYIDFDADIKCCVLKLIIDGKSEEVIMTPFTLNVFLDNLKEVRQKMVQLHDSS